MRTAIVRFGWLTMALTSSTCAKSDQDLFLVRDGRAQCEIVRGQEDDFAGERLARWMTDRTGVNIDVATADHWPPGERGCIVLIGSLASNPALRQAAEKLQLNLDPVGLTDQGYVARRARHDGRDWLILAGGGRDGAIHAVVDLMNWHLDCEGKSVRLGALDVRQVPRFRYRWFWTWDNRMDWGGPGKPVTVMGGGVSHKKAGAYLIDYKRCVDFMADHKFNGLIIWGFLRDHNGGVEAAKELCRYASRRGVRILPGVGTSGYAGYYYEGKNEFNADTWLKKHPELRAIQKDGRPHNAPCPSKKANQDWLDRGAEWLFKEFEVGGVNLEMGDFFVCYCEDCKKARAAIQSDEPDYYKDMAISHMVTLKTMRKLAPQAWLSYATYTGYKAEMMKTPPKFLSMIPEDSLCQWTLTGMAARFPMDARPMAKHSLGYLHWCNSSTHTEDDFYLEQVRSICRNAATVGIEGLDTYGELSDERPNAEIFYLAWEAWLWDPDMTVDQFIDQRLARPYGGPKAARMLLDIIPLVRTRQLRSNPANRAKARALAETGRSAAESAGRAKWDKLIGYLDRQEHLAKEAIDNRAKQEAEARAGEKVAVLSVKAGDEDPAKGWTAAKAIDGNVSEPGGYWLTRSTHPKNAWIELHLAQPSTINRVVLYHQLTLGHYRSLDYTVSVQTEGQWKQVVAVKGNKAGGWVAHAFEPVTTEAVRVDITRSAYGNRMGIGEIELRYCK
jgi:hypothetical protein